MQALSPIQESLRPPAQSQGPCFRLSPVGLVIPQLAFEGLESRAGVAQDADIGQCVAGELPGVDVDTDQAPAQSGPSIEQKRVGLTKFGADGQYDVGFSQFF